MLMLYISAHQGDTVHYAQKIFLLLPRKQGKSFPQMKSAPPKQKQQVRLELYYTPVNMM